MDRLDSPWALCASDISRQHGAQRRLARLSVQIPRAAVTAIIGPNGAGKSTLLRLLGGLEPSQSGQMTLFGTPFSQVSAAQRARQLAWVAQHPPSQLPLSVRACVALGRQPHQAWFQLPSSTDQQAVDQALQAVALSHKASHRFASLSGGERQRVAIARALAQDTPLLLLRQLTRQGKTVVQVLHDLELAASYADWIILLAEGELLAAGVPADALTATVLTRAYQWPITPQRDAEGAWRFCSARAGG